MFNRSCRRIILLLVAVFGLVACGPVSAQTNAASVAPSTTITLGGSGGGTTLLKHIVGPFQTGAAPMTLNFLQGSSSGLAKKAVLDQTLDVAILLSANIAGDRQDGLTLLPLAEDPVAFIVHADLEIGNLTTAQLHDIYLGNITNWSEVGGPDAAIVVLTRDEDEGSTKILREVLFGDASWAESAIVLTKASELTAAVISTPNSIGFGSYGSFLVSDSKVNILDIDGVNPGDYATGRYPFPARTLAIMYAPANESRLQPLLSYLAGEEAQGIMVQAGLRTHP